MLALRILISSVRERDLWRRSVQHQLERCYLRRVVDILVVRVAKRRHEASPVFRTILHVTAEHGHERTVEKLGLIIWLRLGRGRDEVRDSEEKEYSLKEFGE